jgi:cell division protease FtsH
MAQIKRPKKRNLNIGDLILVLILIGIIVGVYTSFMNTEAQPVEFTYSEFIESIEAGNVVRVETVPEAGEFNAGIYNISGQLRDETSFFTKVPTTETYNATIRLLQENQIPFSIRSVNNVNFLSIISWLFPLVLIFGAFFFLMRNSGGSGAGNRAFDFGKSKATMQKGKTTTFKDVAGLDEEKGELEEIIDFLKNPKKYLDIGARIPKGVLLIGPPGTGKTLLARAVAGEADVPFYLISGSDFVEMFVGVGASRVRDMFKNAKATAPCIVFIDEIDAVGRQRGAGMGGGNDEREQTLNQLLVEMDGFGTNSGIIVIAATNRPDVLDPALTRPGRFDRQITINNPDVLGREAILKVHSRNKKVAKDVTLKEIARRTPGFSGADLENLMNEAALLAARENRKNLTLNDIDEAVDRVMMGPAKRSRKYTPKERERVAYHEAGHAVIGLRMSHASVVHKVTIVPRGQAGGYNLMLPDEETFLETKSSLEDKISGFMGGRVAEEIIYNDVSTGAHNDFQRATQIARAMVTEYGMSSLGPIQYERSTGPVFLGRDYTKSRDFSDKVAFDIDNAVREIIDAAYQRSKDVINEHRVLLDTIAHYLLEIETLTFEDIEAIDKTGKLQWWDDKRAEETAAPLIGDTKENAA